MRSRERACEFVTTGNMIHEGRRLPLCVAEGVRAQWKSVSLFAASHRPATQGRRTSALLCHVECELLVECIHPELKHAKACVAEEAARHLFRRVSEKKIGTCRPMQHAGVPPVDTFRPEHVRRERTHVFCSKWRRGEAQAPTTLLLPSWIRCCIRVKESTGAKMATNSLLSSVLCPLLLSPLSSLLSPLSSLLSPLSSLLPLSLSLSFSWRGQRDRQLPTSWKSQRISTKRKSSRPREAWSQSPQCCRLLRDLTRLRERSTVQVDFSLGFSLDSWIRIGHLGRERTRPDWTRAAPDSEEESADVQVEIAK